VKLITQVPWKSIGSLFDATQENERIISIFIAHFNELLKFCAPLTPVDWLLQTMFSNGRNGTCIILVPSEDLLEVIKSFQAKLLDIYTLSVETWRLSHARADWYNVYKQEFVLINIISARIHKPIFLTLLYVHVVVVTACIW
jgi:hypothetical protein